MSVLAAKAHAVHPVFPAGSGVVRKQFQVHWLRTSKDDVAVVLTAFRTNLTAQPFQNGDQFRRLIGIADPLCLPVGQRVGQNLLSRLTTGMGMGVAVIMPIIVIMCVAVVMPVTVIVAI